MPYGTCMNVFRQGIKPLWEDPQLQDGARITVNMPKTHTSKYWEDLMLAMIGENLGEQDQVAGLVMNLKPHSDKIQIWITNASNQESAEALKQQVSKLLSIEEKDLQYQVFKQIEKKDNQQRHQETHQRQGDNSTKKQEQPAKKQKGEEKGEINTDW